MPQVVTRLSSFLIFALVAHAVDAPRLGALTLGTTITGIAVPLAPALVGKPLAAARTDEHRRLLGPQARSAALVGSLAVAIALLVAALATSGLTRVALLGGAIGLPTAIVVETSYWRSVFLDGRRVAGLWYSAAYAVQAGLVVLCVPFLTGSTLVIVSFAVLGVPAVALLVRDHELGLHRARVWVTVHRGEWLPYVIGMGASVGLVQAIPIAFSAAVGFEAAGVYRAGELSFGGTNLLIGIAVQSLLTQESDRPRRTYLRVTVGLVLAAAINGAVVSLLPVPFLRIFFGPTAPLLVAVVLAVTVQRAALAASSVGAILLLPHLPARVNGVLDVLSAAVSLVALVVGTVVGGLQGGLAGLACAEVLLALGAAVLLRRRT